MLYSLCIIMQGSVNRFKVNTTDTTYTFSNLESGTFYSIKGYAWDPDGNMGDDFTVRQITRKTMGTSITMVTLITQFFLHAAK